MNRQVRSLIAKAATGSAPSGPTKPAGQLWTKLDRVLHRLFWFVSEGELRITNDSRNRRPTSMRPTPQAVTRRLMPYGGLRRC